MGGAMMKSVTFKYPEVIHNHFMIRHAVDDHKYSLLPQLNDPLENTKRTVEDHNETLVVDWRQHMK